MVPLGTGGPAIDDRRRSDADLYGNYLTARVRATGPFPQTPRSERCHNSTRGPRCPPASERHLNNNRVVLGGHEHHVVAPRPASGEAPARYMGLRRLHLGRRWTRNAACPKLVGGFTFREASITRRFPPFPSGFWPVRGPGSFFCMSPLRAEGHGRPPDREELALRLLALLTAGREFTDHIPAKVPRPLWSAVVAGGRGVALRQVGAAIASCRFLCRHLVGRARVPLGAPELGGRPVPGPEGFCRPAGCVG